MSNNIAYFVALFVAMARRLRQAPAASARKRAPPFRPLRAANSLRVAALVLTRSPPLL
jgi:hypothetical protein